MRVFKINKSKEIRGITNRTSCYNNSITNFRRVNIKKNNVVIPVLSSIDHIELLPFCY